MKSTVDAKAFSDALKKAGGILKKSVVPILEEIRVDFTNGKCTITATDLATWMTVELPAEGDEFSFVFSNTKKIMKACQYYAGTLTITLSGDEKKPFLNMSCGGKAGEFPVLTEEIFPAPPSVEETHTYRLDTAALLERVSRIQYASARNEKKPVFEGVRFQDCRLWCVDGYRIALSEDSRLRVEEPFIVPVPALKQLKAFGKADVELVADKRFVRFSGNGVSLYSRLLEPSDDIQLERIIPAQWKEFYQVERKQYTDALNYLGANLHNRDKPYVSFHDGKLILLTPSPKYLASLDLDCMCEIEYAFDLHYMKDALGQFPGGDFVTVQASGSLTPVVLTDGKGNMALVLTVRLQEDARRFAA